MNPVLFLAIDVGNTTIRLALMRGLSVEKEYILETPHKRSPVRGLQKCLGALRKSPIEEALCCSVVPAANTALKKAVRDVLSIRLKFIGRDVMVPVKNRYRHPEQVGQDRLVGAYAASVIYGTPVIVIDSGTAITFDVVNHKGDYLGGAIVPGLRLSAESLFAKTALLPLTDIKAPRQVIGKTTQESILSGLFHGYGALCDGMVERMSRSLKEKPQLVLTGGHTSTIRRHMNHRADATDPALVLRGLALLAAANKT